MPWKTHYGEWAEGYEPDWFDAWRKGECDRQKAYRERRKVEEKRELVEWLRRNQSDGAIDLAEAHGLLTESGLRIAKRGIEWLGLRLKELGIAYLFERGNAAPRWKRDLVSWFNARVITGCRQDTALLDLCEDAHKWIKGELERRPRAKSKGMGAMLRAKGIEVKRRADGMVAIGVRVGDKPKPVAVVAKPADHGLI